MTTSLTSETSSNDAAAPQSGIGQQESSAQSPATASHRTSSFALCSEPPPTSVQSPVPDAVRPAQNAVGHIDRAFGLDRGDRRFVTVVGTAALVLMAVHWVRITGWSPAPVQVERPADAAYRFVLDANTATWVEWMQLDGIGETLARRIVADRERRGPFEDVDALRRVPGVGPKTLERMRPHMIVQPPATDPPH